MTSPPKERAAPLEAARFQTSDAENNLGQTQPGCKKKTLPPGYAWEGGSIVPCVMPPTEAEPLTSEQALLKVIGHACGWANGHPAKWQAFLVAAAYDTRTTAEIAESLKISQRAFQLYVKACREWLAELSAELGIEK